MQKMYSYYNKIMDIEEKIEPENIFCSSSTKRLFLD